MTTRADAESEAFLLTTAEGRALLAEAASVSGPGPSELGRWRKIWPAEAVSAALRLADCRRRAAGKFARADRMWLEPTGLEQSTAEAVARHKAARFQGVGGVVVDLCCGLGGDALALGAVAAVLAVDRDAGMARRARWNAGVYGVGDRVAAIRADAGRFGLPGGARVHIDPDRRARGDGRRARSVDDYEPGLPFLLGLSRRCPGGAIKLGPASDFERAFGGEGFELEVVGLSGECKEATAWFGDLAGVRRRATTLPSGASWTDRDGPPGPEVPPAPPGEWVFDPDPALVRSGLLDGFARAHGLSRLAPGVDLLTGPARVASPFLAAFAVEAVLPPDLKRLRRLVAGRRLGPLEIKTRRLDRSPESIRQALRPGGPNPATLLLIGGSRGSTALAILAHRA